MGAKHDCACVLSAAFTSSFCVWKSELLTLEYDGHGVFRVTDLLVIGIGIGNGFIANVLTGGILSVVLDLSYTLCFWISAAVAIISTLLGGLYSGVYTDILQRVLMLISCCICVPFVLINLYSLDIRQALINNTLCGLVLGSLGYQCLHQGTLSASSLTTAKCTCVVAAISIPVLRFAFLMSAVSFALTALYASL